MDGIIAAAGRFPAWLAVVVTFLVVIATFPSFAPTPVFVFGIRLTNWFALWALNVGFVAVVLTLMAIAFFLTRAVVAYIEEGRWPQRAGPVDMGDMPNAVA